MADAPSNLPLRTSSSILSVDAMGGDKGPEAVIGGIARFSRTNPQTRFIVHGIEDELQPLIAQHSLEGACEIRHASEIVKMDDKPAQMMRNGRKTSMWAAINAVKKKDANACVSCGNTGALMAISMVQLRKLAGVNRPAIAIIWPSANPSGFNVFLDAGADLRADAYDLLQYAFMGAAYASKAGLVNATPRVGLLNVGTERHKGHSHLREAYDLLENTQRLGGYEFVGFVEGSDIPSAHVDVIVTDGFTGNVALKTAEGTGAFIRTALRETFKTSALSRVASLLAAKSLKQMSTTLDPRRANGGVFLGLNGTVIKSHGSADDTSVEAALTLAHRLVCTELDTHIEDIISAMGETDADDATPNKAATS